MELKKILNSTGNFIKENKSFCIGTGLFTTAAIVDAYTTINGINSGLTPELNPIPQFFTDNLGVEEGSFLHKTLFGSLAVSYSWSKKRNFVLYGGGLIQGVCAYVNWWLLNS